MKNKHLFLFVLLFLLGTVLAPAQTLLRGRLTTNDAAWQESPFLPGLTVTNLTAVSNLTVGSGVLRPLQSGTNILFETNGGALVINSATSLSGNTNQIGSTAPITLKSGGLQTNVVLYPVSSNAALRLNGLPSSTARMLEAWAGSTGLVVRIDSDGTVYLTKGLVSSSPVEATGFRSSTQDGELVLGTDASGNFVELSTPVSVLAYLNNVTSDVQAQLNGKAGKNAPLLTNVTVYGSGTNALRVNSGVLTSSLPALDISQTWSNSAVPFSANAIWVTNVESGTESVLLAGYHVSNSVPTTNFVFDAAGNLTLRSPSTTAGPRLRFEDNTTTTLASLIYSSDNNLVLRGNAGVSVENSILLFGALARLSAESSGTMQLGADAATTTAQTLKAHDGSGTDKSGADFTLAAGQGTGTGAGGFLYLKTAPAGASSTNTLNSYSNRLTISPNGLVSIPGSLEVAGKPITSVSGNTNQFATNEILTLKSGLLLTNATFDFGNTYLRLFSSADSLYAATIDTQHGIATQIRGGFGIGAHNVIITPNGANASAGVSGYLGFSTLALSSHLYTGANAPDVRLYRDAVATLQLGLDAATPVSQTLKAHDGSGTDKNGADFRLAGGQGTGTGPGGVLNFATAAAGSASTNTLNSYSNRLTIDANGTVTINPTTTNAPELIINSGAVTNSQPALTVYQTWNQSNVSFTASTVLVSNIISSSSSYLQRYFVNTSEVFSIKNDPSGSGVFNFPVGSRRYYAWKPTDGGYAAVMGSEAEGDALYVRPQIGISGKNVVAAAGFLGIKSGTGFGDNLQTSADVTLYRDAAAAFQMGADASSPVAQTFKAHDGSGINIAGADLSLAAGQGTGTGAGGTLLFKTSPAGASSTNALNAYVTRAVVTPSGNVGFNTTNPTALLHLVPLSSTSTGLLVKAAASQSADLFRVENSSGSKQISVRSDGALDYADNAVIGYVSGTSVVRWGGSRQSFGNQVAISSANNVSSPDLFLTRDAAAALQLGEDAATPIDQTLKAADGSGTDKNGAALTVVGGKSTGAGAGGALVAKTSLTGGGGSSSANNHSTRGYTYAAEKSLTDATATGILDVVIDSGKYLGGDLFITFVAKDGFGGWSVNTVRINVSAYNDAGTVNASYSTQQSSVVHAVAGTETITFSTSTPASGTLRLSATFTSDSWAEVPTDIRAKWQFVVNSDSEAPVTPL